MKSKAERERELNNLPMDEIVAIYKQVKGIPMGQLLTAGKLKSQMIQEILEQEFPAA